MGIIYLIAFVNFVVLTAAKTRAIDGNQHSLVGQWLSYIVSRGFYFLLICMIFLCFIITTIKSKVEKNNPIKKQSVAMWTNSNYVVDDNNTDHSSSNDLVSARGKLLNAEEMIISLKNELQETQRTVSCLETTLDDAGRSRIGSEEDLFNSRMDIDLEVENLKKEKELLEKQFHRASKTIDNMTRQIEVLQREAKITEAAIQDNDSLSERLTGARQEVEGLKMQLQGIKVERDTAVRFAAEHIHKMTEKTSPQKIEIIEDMIDEELKRLREEEESKERVGYGIKQIYSDVRSQDRGDVPFSVQSTPTVFGPSNATGDGPTANMFIEEDMETETSTYSDNTLSNTDDSKKLRIVTRSPAFKAFLHDIFGQTV